MVGPTTTDGIAAGLDGAVVGRSDTRIGAANGGVAAGRGRRCHTTAEAMTNAAVITPLTTTIRLARVARRWAAVVVGCRAAGRGVGGVAGGMSSPAAQNGHTGSPSSSAGSTSNSRSHVRHVVVNGTIAPWLAWQTPPRPETEA